jgi:hypothetical protein
VAWRPRLRRSPIRPPADGDGDPPPPPPRGAHATTSPSGRRGAHTRTDGWMAPAQRAVRACVVVGEAPAQPQPQPPFLSPRASGRRSRAPGSSVAVGAGLGSGPSTTPHHTGGVGWMHDGDSRDPRGSSHRIRRARGRRRSFPGRKLPRAWNDGDGRASLGGNQSKVFVSTWSPCSFLLVYHRVLCLSLAFACFSPFFFPSSYQVICFPQFYIRLLLVHM